MLTRVLTRPRLPPQDTDPAAKGRLGHTCTPSLIKDPEAPMANRQVQAAQPTSTALPGLCCRTLGCSQSQSAPQWVVGTEWVP